MTILGMMLGGNMGRKPLRVFNAVLRVLGYDDEDRADQLGRTPRTIGRWDKEDKERPCVGHVLTVEIRRKHIRGKTGGAGTKERITEVKRCRFCDHERPGKTRFFQVN